MLEILPLFRAVLKFCSTNRLKYLMHIIMLALLPLKIQNFCLSIDAEEKQYFMVQEQ